jgi:DNA processing protein
MNEQERQALIALAHVIEPGDKAMIQRIWRIGPHAALEYIQSPRCSWTQAETLCRRLEQPRPELRDARIVTAEDPEWPTQLNDLAEHRPLALWVRGSANLRLMMIRSIAVVGARAATPYGIRVCQSWIPDLCQSGFTVVSGAAYGIDAAAHRAALTVNGMTAAVLACGVDIAYPASHDALIERIAEEGLIISESPPGEQVRRQRFLTRNRIIAALTRATVVVEAAFRSGTTSTANAASTLLRPVMAVPGPVTSLESAGCHELIRQSQAILVTSPQDIIEVVDPSSVRSLPQEPTLWDSLSRDQQRVLDAFPRRGNVDPGELCLMSGLSMATVLTAVAHLEVHGAIRQRGGGYVRRVT